MFFAKINSQPINLQYVQSSRSQLKFSCPKCKAKLEIQKTFNKKIHISCDNCGIEDLLEFSKNIDEVFLEFLSRFDEGLITKKRGFKRPKR